MKRTLLISALAALCTVGVSARETIDKLEAFPGAEGYGRYTTGGRGGKVYHVTTLEDTGEPGSLRYAVNQSGTRTIVFDVSGNIHLNSELQLRSGNVTIAGQTAPGDGICIADYPFSIKANNVILRFLRFRLGNANVTKDGADGWDGLGSLDQRDIIVDHCSVSWSIDECLSFSGTHNTTVQWCIVSQSLVNSGHSKGGHGYGGNWGGEYGSYHHNLLAHHTSRSPRLGPRPSTQLNEVMDMRNNVMFNYSGESCYGGEGMNVNIVNNFYKPGPGNKYSGKTKETRIASVGIRTVDYCLDKTKIATAYNNAMGTSISTSSIKGSFVNGKKCVTISGKRYEISDDNKITVDDKTVNISWNAYAPALHLLGTYYVDGNENHNISAVKSDNWGLGVYDQISRYENCPDEASWTNTKQDMRRDLPIEYVYTTTHSPQDAYTNVLAYAGASLKRDALDEMVVNDAKNNVANSGTGSGLDRGFINVPDDVTYPSGTELDGVLPALKSTQAMKDSDGDGMPDDWETANGLDPNDATDGAKASDSGFTNLELYLNSIVAHIMEAGNANGKMLNGELTFADDAVELPVYDPNGGDGEVKHEDYVLAISTSDGSETGVWHFSNGIDILTDKGYSNGVEDCIKFSRNVNFTVAMPEGLIAEGVTFYGYANATGADGYMQSVNGEDTSSEFIFPAKIDDGAKGENVYKEYTKMFDTPVSQFVFRPAGQQLGLKLTIHAVKGSTSAIEDIITDSDDVKGNGKIYNIMGVEVHEPLLPGVYIRDGKKFIVR